MLNAPLELMESALQVSTIGIHAIGMALVEFIPNVEVPEVGSDLIGNQEADLVLGGEDVFQFAVEIFRP